MAGNPVSEHRPEHHHDGEAAAGRHQRKTERRAEQGVVEAFEEIGPTQRQDQRHDGRRQERHQKTRTDQLRRIPGARAMAVHAPVPGGNPKRARTCCPIGESSSSTKSCASAGSLEPETTATGYWASTFSSGGMPITSTAREVAASVRQTIAASASPSATFESTWRTFTSRETTRASTRARKSAPYRSEAA